MKAEINSEGFEVEVSQTDIGFYLTLINLTFYNTPPLNGEGLIWLLK